MMLSELFTLEIQKIGGKYHGQTWKLHHHKQKLQQTEDFSLYQSEKYCRFDIRLNNHFWTLDYTDINRKWTTRDKITEAILKASQVYAQSYSPIQLTIF